MALTKSDKTFIATIFTKTLANQEAKFEKALFKQDIRIENELLKQELKFEAKIVEVKSDFYEKIDPILKEVVASREDREIRAEQHLRNQDRIEKLEEIHPQGKHLATI